MKRFPISQFSVLLTSIVILLMTSSSLARTEPESYGIDSVSLDLGRRLEELFSNANLREVDIREEPPYITGYFILGTCGANCSNSSLTWIYQNRVFDINSPFPDALILKETAKSIMLPYIAINKTKKYIVKKNQPRLQGIWSKHQYVLVKGNKIPVPTYLPYENREKKTNQKPQFYYYLDTDFAAWPNYYFNFGLDPRCDWQYCASVGYSVYSLSKNSFVEGVISEGSLKEVELFEGSQSITAYFIPKRKFRRQPARFVWFYDEKMFALDFYNTQAWSDSVGEEAIPELKKSAESVMKAYKPLKSRY
jgi:hypothetical protein